MKAEKGKLLVLQSQHSEGPASDTSLTETALDVNSSPLEPYVPSYTQLPSSFGSVRHFRSARDTADTGGKSAGDNETEWWLEQEHAVRTWSLSSRGSGLSLGRKDRRRKWSAVKEMALSEEDDDKEKGKNDDDGEEVVEETFYEPDAVPAFEDAMVDTSLTDAVKVNDCPNTNKEEGAKEGVGDDEPSFATDPKRLLASGSLACPRPSLNSMHLKQLELVWKSQQTMVEEDAMSDGVALPPVSPKPTEAQQTGSSKDETDFPGHHRSSAGNEPSFSILGAIQSIAAVALPKSLTDTGPQLLVTEQNPLAVQVRTFHFSLRLVVVA